MRLIDADALKKTFIEECCGCCDNCSHCMTGYKCELIDNAPTVTPDKIQALMSDYLVYRCEPQRPQGKWIDVKDTETKINGYCSNCGWQSKLYEEDILGMPFCPNCGADMRGGAE